VPESNTLPGTGFGDDVGDGPGHGDDPTRRRDPRPPRGGLERGREGDRQRRRQGDRGATEDHEDRPGASGMGPEPPRRREESGRRDSRDHRPPDARNPRAEEPVAGAGPRPRPGGGEQGQDGTGEGHPRPGEGSVGLRRRRDRGVAELVGEAFGTEHAAPDRNRAREAHGLVTGAASGDRRPARMVQAPLVGGGFGTVGPWAGRRIGRRLRGGRSRVLQLFGDPGSPLLRLHPDSVRPAWTAPLVA
jgi:hypothetical protein